MSEIERGFNLQLFADDSEGYSVDEALDVINGTNQEPEQQEEPAQEQPDQQPETQTEPEQQLDTEQPEIEQEEPAEEQTVEPEQKAPDFNQVIKFKENGQEVELTLAQLIDRAQKGSNYERRMQEVAQQQKAYEASLQQHKQEPPDPAKQFEELNDKVTARAMKMLGITDPSQFEPDATGMLGNKVHFAAYQKALLDVQQEEHSQQMQIQEYQTQEQRYATFIDTNWKDSEVEKINEFALNSFYALPQNGKEGIAEFNKLYPIYQKIQQRDEYWRGNKNIRIDPFTASELDTIEKFFDKAKTEYKAKQTKEQVKAQVPKSVPIKPTVKVEGTGDNEPVPAKKIDFKKFRNMDIDDIAKQL